MQRCLGCVCALGLMLTAVPAWAQQGIGGRGGAGGPVSTGIPSMPFESLFQLDESGRPVPIDGSLDLRAMYNNGFIGELTWQRAIPHIRDWQKKIDRLVTENADIVIDLDHDFLPNYDQTDTNRLLYVNSAVQLLMSAGPLTDYLAEKGVLSRIQAGHNKRIIADYQQKYMFWHANQAQERFPDDQDSQMQLITAANYREALRDVMETYEDALRAIADNPDAVDSSLADTFRDAGSADDKISLLEDALAEMDYQARSAALAAGLALRPEPLYGPDNPDIEIKHNTRVMEGGVKVIDDPAEIRRLRRQEQEGGGGG